MLHESFMVEIKQKWLWIWKHLYHPFYLFYRMYASNAFTLGYIIQNGFSLYIEIENGSQLLSPHAIPSRYGCTL